MDIDGRIGTEIFERGDSDRPGDSNACGAVGLYGRGMKSVPRHRRFRSLMSRRHAKVAGLFILFAVAILVISAVSLAPSGGEKASNERTMSKAPPGFPYLVAGHIYAADGTTPVAGASVTVENERTHEYKTVTTDGAGYYSVDINDQTGSFPSSYVNGDTVLVTATDGVMSGSKTGTVDDTVVPFTVVDVSLTVAIPEFSMVLVPVVGIMGLVAVASLRRKANQ